MAERIVKKVKIEVTDNGSLKKTSKDSQTLNRNMKGLSKQSSNSSKNFSKTAQGMQGVLVPAYAEVAARVFALTAVYQALSKAADFRILMQGQAEYAKRTGKNMADIAKQVQKASKGMLDFASASSQVALATTSGISASQIVKMTKASVDSSTALGRSVTDTMDRLTRGIVKAEPEILDEIGVIIRLDKVYKDYAASVKKSTAELSEGEKATARYNAIMGQLEDKFGGIGDAVDPNYMRAAAASVMDILAQAGAKLVGFINPFMKFLSESKTAIVVILLVVLKTLAGKVFPAFESFGKRIAEMPMKMGRNVKDLTSKINAMNQALAKSRTMATNTHKALDKAMPSQYRGAAFAKGEKLGGRKGQEMKLRSMRASLQAAERTMGAGNKISSGKYMGMTRVELNQLKLGYKALKTEVGKTHTEMEVRMQKSRIAILTVRKAIASLVMGFKQAAFSAATYFTQTKGFIADQGILKGMWAGIRAIGMEWKMAATGATIYAKAIKGVTAATALLGVVAAGAAAAVSALFGIVMWLTLIVSLGKMVLNMFVDFDTPFKRAADASKVLSDEMREQSNLYSQKDDTINFEGAAASFDEAMQNATFMDNFATSMYESTSKAMKALSAEMDDMGFWEGTFDWIKGIFNMSASDVQLQALTRSANLMMEATPGSALNVATELGGGTKSAFKGDYKAARAAYIASLPIESRDILNKRGELGKDHEFKQTDAYKSGSVQVPKTLIDLINELGEDDYEGRLKIYEKINAEASKLQKKERLRINDLRAMNNAFDQISKSEKKYAESLNEQTAVHDMAVEQKKLIGLMKSDKTFDSTKVLALEKRGLLDKYEGSATYDKMKAFMKDGDQKKAAETAAELFKELGSDTIHNIVGGLRDWIAVDKELQDQIQSGIIHNQSISNAKKYGPNVSGGTRSSLDGIIAQIAVDAAKSVYATQVSDNEATPGTHSAMAMRTSQFKIWNLEQAQHLGGNYSQSAYNLKNKKRGMGGSIEGKYDAINRDLEVGVEAWAESAFMPKQWKKIFEKWDLPKIRNWIEEEKELAYLQEAHKIMDAIGQSAEQTAAVLTNSVAALEKANKYGEWIKRLESQGWGKYIDMDDKDALEKMNFGTKEEKSLPMKIKAATLEIAKLGLDAKYRGDTKAVLDYRKKVAEIELNAGSEWYKSKMKGLELVKSIERAYSDVRKAQYEQDIGWLRDSIKGIADAFGNAIKGALNDVFMNKGFSMDKMRTTLAQGFASGASNTLGSMAQKQVFGNKGFIAEALRGTALAPFVDDLFPKSQLEVAKESLDVLKDIREGKKRGSGITGAATSWLTELLGPKSGGVSPGAGNTRGSSGGGFWSTLITAVMQGLMGGANGGIAPGGYRAFANGGIVNKPTLGMIGEGRYDEAVVPLPNGKSIPISGNTGNVTVNVSVDSDGRSKTEADGGESAKKLGFLVSQAVQSEIVDQQRPGGLLSAY